MREFEAQPVGLLRRPPGANDEFRDRRARDRPRARRHRTRATRSSRPPLSWVATANVIVRAGARPVFVDVDPAHPQHRPGAHRGGHHARARACSCRSTWPACRSIARGCMRSRTATACACSRTRRSRWGRAGRASAIGAGGDLVAISFHANKNITTAEGGCLVLNDDAEARRCELWRLQGVERFADGELRCDAGGRQAQPHRHRRARSV